MTSKVRVISRGMMRVKIERRESKRKSELKPAPLYLRLVEIE